MKFDHYELGYDIPALPGMVREEICTPALVLDLDALEFNLRAMGDFVARNGLRLRAHGKMHKSVDIAKLQIGMGNAHGICCQKVAEAEVFARGGIPDILVSNQVRSATMIDRLAQLPKLGSTISVCIDDLANVYELSQAASRHGATISALVEIDCGAGRCGVTDPDEAVVIAKAINNADGLIYDGIQAYHGSLQHIYDFAKRSEEAARSHAIVKMVIATLRGAGLVPNQVSGAGTGSYMLDTRSGLYTELQCGSYAFMDADYGRIEKPPQHVSDAGPFKNALFVLTSVISNKTDGRVVVDAGHKSHAIDSGLPIIADREGFTFVSATDEHGVVTCPTNTCEINDRLALIPGHCDPTVNLHDWYVGVRNDVVEAVWPVSGRGKIW